MQKSLQEIKDKLNEWNIGLGMTDYSAQRNYLKLTMRKEETDGAQDRVQHAEPSAGPSQGPHLENDDRPLQAREDRHHQGQG